MEVKHDIAPLVMAVFAIPYLTLFADQVFALSTNAGTPWERPSEKWCRLTTGWWLPFIWILGLLSVLILRLFEKEFSGFFGFILRFVLYALPVFSVFLFELLAKLPENLSVGTATY